MIAIVRPSDWNGPLFLHVLGAIVLVGALLAVVVLAATAGRRERAALSRSTFLVTLILVLPAWLLMRLAGEWTRSREGYTGDDDPGWLGVGYLVGDAGLLLLILLTGFAFAWARRGGERPWQRVVVLGISGLYLAMLAVAWWAMSGKPG